MPRFICAICSSNGSQAVFSTAGITPRALPGNAAEEQAGNRSPLLLTSPRTELISMVRARTSTLRV